MATDQVLRREFGCVEQRACVRLALARAAAPCASGPLPASHACCSHCYGAAVRTQRRAVTPSARGCLTSSLQAAVLRGPAVAQLVGSGNSRPDGELPIDINYAKLAEWLVSRKKMVSDWHKRLAAIQAKITEAAKELPPGLLVGLPGGADAPIDYFRAAAIRDKLAEGGERTLFGGLAGAAGVWDAIVKAYEKNSTQLEDGPGGSP
jgi:hypothetical protein